MTKTRRMRGGFVFLFTDAASIQLGACWDVVVDDEQVQVFFAVFLVDALMTMPQLSMPIICVVAGW